MVESWLMGVDSRSAGKMDPDSRAKRDRTYTNSDTKAPALFDLSAKQPVESSEKQP